MRSLRYASLGCTIMAAACQSTGYGSGSTTDGSAKPDGSSPATLADAAAAAPADAGSNAPRDANPHPDTGLATDALPIFNVKGRVLSINGVPFEIKAIAWNPVKKGGTYPADLDFTGTVETDATLMQAIGLNAVRSYEPITDLAVLDSLQRHGLRLLNTVYSYGGDPIDAVVARVKAVQNHPAMLGWVVGNEWNYNGLYVGLSQADATDRLNQVMAKIRTLDTRLPIFNIYGEVPPTEVLAAMPLTDVWGINAYRGLSFGDLFTTFAARSAAPLFMGEYGADAWNALLPGEDQASQALAVESLTREIHAQWSGRGGVAVGGSLFEWCDEWWKDGAGSPATHDTGGVAPGGGPYPDQTFNEEWWGVVDIDRKPRTAYQALGRGWLP